MYEAAYKEAGPEWSGVYQTSKVAYMGYTLMKDKIAMGSPLISLVSDILVNTQRGNSPSPSALSINTLPSGATAKNPESSISLDPGTGSKGGKPPSPTVTNDGKPTPPVDSDLDSDVISKTSNEIIRKYGENNKIFTAEAAEKARALLKSKLGILNAGLDPEAMFCAILRCF